MRPEGQESVSNKNRGYRNHVKKFLDGRLMAFSGETKEDNVGEEAETGWRT